MRGKNGAGESGGAGAGTGAGTGARTGAGAPVSVDALEFEVLRAPNFAPNRMSVVLVNYMNPTPFDDQVVPPDVNTAQNTHGFPMRDFQLW